MQVMTACMTTNILKVNAARSHNHDSKLKESHITTGGLDTVSR